MEICAATDFRVMSSLDLKINLSLPRFSFPHESNLNATPAKQLDRYQVTMLSGR